MAPSYAREAFQEENGKFVLNDPLIANGGFVPKRHSCGNDSITSTKTWSGFLKWFGG